MAWLRRLSIILQPETQRYKQNLCMQTYIGLRILVYIHTYILCNGLDVSHEIYQPYTLLFNGHMLCSLIAFCVKCNSLAIYPALSSQLEANYWCPFSGDKPIVTRNLLLSSTTELLCNKTKHMFHRLNAFITQPANSITSDITF